MKYRVIACVLLLNLPFLHFCEAQGSDSSPSKAGPSPVVPTGAQEKIPSSVPPPENSLSHAWDLMRLGQWNDAEHLLNKLHASSGKENQAKLKFAEANLWANRSPSSDIEKAQDLFKEIFTTYRSSPEAPWAMLAMARLPDLQILHPDPASSVPLYRQVMTDFPESDAAQEACIHLGLALWEAEGTAGAEKGVKEIVAWRKAHPSAKYDAIAELELGKLYRYPLKDFPQAAFHLENAFKAGLHSDPQRSATLWTIASIAEHELKNRDLAVVYYTRFVEDFPQDSIVFRAKEALRRLNAPLPKETPITPPPNP